jgi:hypothetical protein
LFLSIIHRKNDPVSVLSSTMWPKKLIVAKTKKMVKRGWVRGGQLTASGRDFLMSLGGWVGLFRCRTCALHEKEAERAAERERQAMEMIHGLQDKLLAMTNPAAYGALSRSRRPASPGNGKLGEVSFPVPDWAPTMNPEDL